MAANLESFAVWEDSIARDASFRPDQRRAAASRADKLREQAAECREHAADGTRF